MRATWKVIRLCSMSVVNGAPNSQPQRCETGSMEAVLPDIVTYKFFGKTAVNCNVPVTMVQRNGASPPVRVWSPLSVDWEHSALARLLS
jgi:hypothetical protein